MYILKKGYQNFKHGNFFARWRAGNLIKKLEYPAKNRRGGNCDCELSECRR